MTSYTTEDDEQVVPTPRPEEEATLYFAGVANPTLSTATTLSSAFKK